MFTEILLKTLSTLAFTAMALGVRAAAQTFPWRKSSSSVRLIALLVLFALAWRRAAPFSARWRRKGRSAISGAAF